jgi:hypothetical protein
MNVSISESLAKELRDKSNGKSIEELTQEAIRLWLRIQSQEEIKLFRGKLKWEENLDAIREDQ